VDLPQPIRVLVVDDHVAVRRGLRELLEAEPDLRVIAAAAGAEEAMLIAEDERIDVAVVDFQLPGRNGLWVSRKLKRLPNPPRVLIYSAYGDGPLAAAAVAAEADGLVSKACLGSELCHAVRQVAAGQILLPAVPSSVAELIRRRLDDEEQAIFGMVLAGIARLEIATILRISLSELESRLSEMVRKLERIEPVAPRRWGRTRASRT
jgi:DNA-binding NarL/FixJ family response regulator